MSSLGKVSDEEVSSTIRYLDPDFQVGVKVEERPHGPSRARRWAILGLVVLSIGAALYVAAVRYLPAVMRLFN